MPIHPIETHYFVLVVVRLGHRFLLVHERKHGETWYLPAGKLESGESFVEAAVRETREEAGLPIVVEGILRLEHTPYFNAARMRVIFVARPADDTPPLKEPNEDSLEARWVSLEEMKELNLRGEEVRMIFEYVAKGAPIYPLSLLTFEGAPYPSGGAK